MEKVAVVAPAGTVTVAGGVTAEEFELVSVMTFPLAPAGPERVTVPEKAVPPVTEPGVTV